MRTTWGAGQKRWIAESRARSALLPTGLKALWFRVTGKYRQIKKENENEAIHCKLRDQAEMQKLIEAQLKERRNLQHEIRMLRHHHSIQIKILHRDMGRYLKLSTAQQEDILRQQVKRSKSRKRTRSPSRDYG